MRTHQWAARHPHLTTIAVLAFGLVVFGELSPRLTGTPPDWRFVITMSLFAAGLNLVVRVASARVVAYLLLGLSLVALAFYAYATYRWGIPEGSERVYWGMVTPLPIAGVALSAWMLKRYGRRV